MTPIDLPRMLVESRRFTPTSEDALWRYVRAFTGVSLSRARVCPGHHSPWEAFASAFLHRPPLALVLGARGAGKSFLSALETHLTSRWHPGHETRILGGSRDQSLQIYRALTRIVRDGAGVLGSESDSIQRLLKHEAVYQSGAEVSILAASPTSVRGPHVPSLKLDEVDEIDPDCREAAMGMCMSRPGMPASVLMTSTWHRLGGPMEQLIERARAGVFPMHVICVFDVLETCSEERSGKALEKCGLCPLQTYCHDVADGGPPKAKRSSGHYGIDALIQKVQSTSVRTFEADYLCRGPKADGLWFPSFTESSHVSDRAEYDPTLPVHLSIDSGVFTGAVFFQVRPGDPRTPRGEQIHVFADYLREGAPAESNARALLDLALTRCQGRLDTSSTDPAGGSRNPVGPTVIAEYERVGIRPLVRWPIGSVADGLSLVESFIQPAEGKARLAIHPRCRALIAALASYRRAKRGGQWQDYPEDPQHPHEDLVDALRGGLRVCFPGGRLAGNALPRVPVRQVL